MKTNAEKALIEELRRKLQLAEHAEVTIKELTGEINRLSLALSDVDAELQAMIEKNGKLSEEMGVMSKANGDLIMERDDAIRKNILLSIDLTNLTDKVPADIAETVEGGQANNTTEFVSDVVGIVQAAIDLKEKYSPTERGVDQNGDSDKPETKESNIGNKTR